MMKKHQIISLYISIIMVIAAYNGFPQYAAVAADIETDSLLAQFFPKDPTPFKRLRHGTPSKRYKQKREIDKDTYQLLVNDLKQIQSVREYDALIHVQNLDVLLYWQIGERLSDQDKKAHSQDFMSKLSQDINMDQNLLGAILKFYQLYKNAADLTIDLSWKHYFQLIRVENNENRTRLQKEAIRQQWTAEDLELRINQQ